MRAKASRDFDIEENGSIRKPQMIKRNSSSSKPQVRIIFFDISNLFWGLSIATGPLLIHYALIIPFRSPTLEMNLVMHFCSSCCTWSRAFRSAFPWGRC